MTKREIVRRVFNHERPPYVPWHFAFTLEAAQRLERHYGTSDLDTMVENHMLMLGADMGFFDDAGNGCVRDMFGVLWDRSIDKDIGVVKETVLPEPTLEGFTFPDPHNPRFFADIEERIARHPDRFRVYQVGFSLFERAWTMRGMPNLLTDMLTNPDFAHDLFSAIADYNIAQVRRALEHDIDAVYFGDDWGQQRGLIMGPEMWREFIKPHLARTYAVVKKAGKFVYIHSCGDVDELFDDLIEVGLDCFNPFQPEVMDTAALLEQYRGRLAFHGGLSTQKVLPYCTPDEVRAETRRLLAMGAAGDFILAPAHAVEGDVPLENMLAFIEAAQAQAGYAAVT